MSDQATNNAKPLDRMPVTLSPRQRKRRRAIVNELSNLSRDGWSRAKSCDYAPLEAELRALGDA